MEFKKNPEAVTASAIEHAKTTSLIKSMQAKGASHEEIVKAVLGDVIDDEDFVKDIQVLVNLGILGFYFGYTRRNNPALRGYSYIIQHYTDHPEAVKYQLFYKNARTYQDLYNFFCDETGIDPDKVKTFEGYDQIWFNNWLETELTQNVNFGLSEEHSKKLSQSFNK